MRKRDELVDPQSCLNRAKPDEWLFVLLGRDEDAPATVLDWIERRLRRGKNAPDDPQIVEARKWVETVQTEQREPRKPDLSTECPGHRRGGKGEPCCNRAGEYNGFGSDGPLAFTCPKRCSCHD
jgi:hypothetical protein